MKLTGTYKGTPFTITEGAGIENVKCADPDFYELNADIYYNPGEGQETGFMSVTDGLLEAYLVLNHLSKFDNLDIELNEVPNELVLPAPEEDEEGNPIVY